MEYVHTRKVIQLDDISTFVVKVDTFRIVTARILFILFHIFYFRNTVIPQKNSI